MKYYTLKVNLQKSIVHTGNPNNLGAIVAVYDKHNKNLFMRTEYTKSIKERDKITNKVVPAEDHPIKIKRCDSFDIGPAN